MDAILALLTHAVTFIPVVGPVLAAVIGGVAALWQPARAATVGAATAISDMAKAIFASPAALAAVAGALITLLVLLLIHLCGLLATAKAALIDPATKATWQAEYLAAASASKSYLAANGQLNAGLVAANASIAAYKAASDARAKAAAVQAAQTAPQVQALRQGAASDRTAAAGDDACLAPNTLILKEMAR
ncbi:MAG TPA: hypothetical protein VMU59_14305 [Caulobacteraceae bacterium]|nr:hypothetical protein [Caulobacteraceae bacterium]